MVKKYAFYAQTSSGYVIKGIFEILLECLTNEVPICIKESGIEACCIDKNNRQLVALALPMSKFDKKYVCKTDRLISIHLKTFCKFIKNVKKKDSLTLFLDDDDSLELGIQITPLSSNTDNDGKEISRMKVRNVICPKIIIPEGYYYPKSMKSVSYQKMCKKMAAFERSTIHVTMQKQNYVAFKGSTDIIHTMIECGDIEEEDKDPLYEANFSMDSLNQFVKISTLSPTIQISAPMNEKFPLKIEAQTSLGTFKAFVKTEEQIEADKKLLEEKAVLQPKVKAEKTSSVEESEEKPKKTVQSKSGSSTGLVKATKSEKDVTPKGTKSTKSTKAEKDAPPPKAAGGARPSKTNQTASTKTQSKIKPEKDLKPKTPKRVKKE